MGGEVCVDDQFYIVSNNIWHLDTECIEDHGDYVRIIERFKDLTSADIRNINDYIDIVNDVAKVSFEYKNKNIEWDLMVDDDWIDPKLFDKLTDLIDDNTNRKIVIATLGQDCLIAYMNEEQRKEINKLVKYKFE